MDPTQVVQIRVIAPDGEEIVPAVGTVYRTSNEAGEFTEDLVFVAMTQEQYNHIQGMLQANLSLGEQIKRLTEGTRLAD
jgi:hypothetical protein